MTRLMRYPLSAALLAAALAATGCGSHQASAPETTTVTVTASETTPTPTPSPDKPVAGKKILLDPGHSGALVGARRQVSDGRGGMKDCNNSGTETAQGYSEHRFNWEVVTRLKALLEADGALVTLTRNDDTSMGPCVDERGKMTAGQDLAVSVHANGTTNTRVKGFFALVSSPPLNDNQGQPSIDLAYAILDSLEAAGFDKSPNYEDGISYRSDLAGLNFAQSPTVMMELGEMRNPEEAAVLTSPEGQDRYAQALYDGIATWFTEHPEHGPE